MDNTNRIIDHAETHCKTLGARLTTKRKRVLSTLLNSGKALSAYELIDAFKDEYGDSMPAMSMYRILDFLQEKRLVHKLSLANKFVACSHITCGHKHAIPQFLICGKCQKVEEVSIHHNTIDELKQNVANAGFHLVSPQLEMNCICDGCLTKAA